MNTKSGLWCFGDYDIQLFRIGTTPLLFHFLGNKQCAKNKVETFKQKQCTLFERRGCVKKWSENKEKNFTRAQNLTMWSLLAWVMILCTKVRTICFAVVPIFEDVATRLTTLFGFQCPKTVFAQTTIVWVHLHTNQCVFCFCLKQGCKLAVWVYPRATGPLWQVR